MSSSFLGNIKVASTIGELTSSSRYQNHLQAIAHALQHHQNQQNSNIGENPFIHSLEEDPDYQLVMKSNQIIQEIDEEIIATYRFVQEIYTQKFPELESLIANRIDYIKVIQRIGNEMDLTLVNLQDLLSSQVVMIVTVSASTTAGKPLSSTQLQDCLTSCQEILTLYQDKNQILTFIQSRINKIAPNLCALIGSLLTAQLIGLAGGLIPLSKIPGCNIMVMGQPKKNLMGLSFHSTMPHAGILSTSELVTNAPPLLKKKMLKTIANKVALASRMDAYPTMTPAATNVHSHNNNNSNNNTHTTNTTHNIATPAPHHQPIASTNNTMPPPPPRFSINPNAMEEEDNDEDEDLPAVPSPVDAQAPAMVINSDGGNKLRTFVESKLEKLQEPAKARTKKALPIPEEKKKARRGGKRIRKMKEKLMMTDIRKQQNQLKMTVTDGEYGESSMGMDQGMFGQSEGGLGRIRAPKKTQQTQRLLQTKKVIQSAKSLSSGATGGMSSSLVFTPVQGLELVNPNAAADRVKEANQKWFNSQSGFLSAMPKTH